ncbi:glycosyltransferase [Caulobacter sp. S45]|uniref:glycosyltransferase family protein n=1 Tax=Caulobacter sp. S45 TaxID=1641861 RepID=UPI00131D1E59|nr:glycosyltransferase [Caulobacter sp. S45]
MRAVMVKGNSQYGGTRFFVDHAAAAFRRIGFDVEVLDLSASDDIPAALRAAASTPTDLVFTINYLGEFRDEAGRTLAQMFDAPHVLWHTDYVLAHEKRVPATAPSTALLVVDPTQVDAIDAIFGPGRFAHLGFFPHPAVGEAAPTDADVEAFLRARPIPLLWSGSLQRAGPPPWSNMPEAVQQIFDAALELALSVEWTPPHLALDQVLRSIGLDLADPDLIAIRMGARLVDMAVRLTRRSAFVDALAATGLPLHICGAGWEDELHRFPNAVYEGPVEMSRTTELMRQSRVVLNTNGNFGAGSHERPFSALLAGAAVFSDHSRYYALAFAADEIALFHWKALDAGMDALERLTGAPEDAYAMARKGKARVLAEHTWDHRIALILEAARRIRHPHPAVMS